MKIIIIKLFENQFITTTTVKKWMKIIIIKLWENPDYWPDGDQYLYDVNVYNIR